MEMPLLRMQFGASHVLHLQITMEFLMSAMSLNTVEEERILKLLKDEGSKTIVLVGKPGSGKTWMAKKLSARATRERLFDFILWVFLNRNYDTKAFYNSIARQLFQLSTTKGFEVDHNVDIEEVPEEENLEVLEKKISAALERKKFLLILDDEGNKMKEEEIKALFPVSQKNSCKVLITSVNGDRHKTFETKTVIEVNTLSANESWSLLKQRTGSKVWHWLKLLLKGVWIYLPAAIVIIAKAISYFSERVSGMRTLESALDEAFDGENKNFIQLLSSAYDMLPSTILMDCTWRGSHFFRNRGNIHYNELIAYWIMEGYFGHIDCIEKAYEEGHRVLMELIDCRLLKKVDADCIIMERSVEADYILMERSMLSLEDCHRFLISGAKSFAEFQNPSFETNAGLKIIDLSGTKVESLPSNIGNPHHLYLKGCFMLKELTYMKALKDLEALHLSVLPPLGSLTKLEELNLSSVKCFGESGADFLEHMGHLRILDLSETLLKKLPSMSKLKDLKQLFLRGCQLLESLQDLEALTKLEVLDLSGTALTHLPPLNNFTNLRQLVLRDCANLEEFLHLEMCDSSGAIIKVLPYGISELTCLEQLDLPNMMKNQGADEKKINCLEEEPNQYQWHISSLPDMLTDNCCPKISSVFSSSQKLENLEVLEIKFCDKLEALFDDKLTYKYIS
ncbi:hypothetical protein HYC85_026703 [Camellia sinensis]|uniref:NB-ARC domain-containing protein n=1 Tax=Camellia sinensis TaxID=4442 RepID=A0A7J7G8B0_CAMSI|nr:hypothetical protein HYC85_026703 [Camellia sinensis]